MPLRTVEGRRESENPEGIAAGAQGLLMAAIGGFILVTPMLIGLCATPGIEYCVNETTWSYLLCAITCMLVVASGIEAVYMPSSIVVRHSMVRPIAYANRHHLSRDACGVRGWRRL